MKKLKCFLEMFLQDGIVILLYCLFMLLLLVWMVKGQGKLFWWLCTSCRRMPKKLPSFLPPIHEWSKSTMQVFPVIQAMLYIFLRYSIGVHIGWRWNIRSTYFAYIYVDPLFAGKRCRIWVELFDGLSGTIEAYRGDNKVLQHNSQFW